MLVATPALETSPDDFAARFAPHAARGELWPQPEGSPLMEFVVGGLPLYLFDRTGPYTAKPGLAWVVIHGTLQHYAPLAQGRPQLSSPGVSQLEGVGQVIAVESRRTVVVEARMPLVLSGFEPLKDVQLGDWLSFVTEAPLHGFLVKE